MKLLHSIRFAKSCTAALLVVAAFFAGSVSAQTVPPAARSELAPGGKLRVGLLVTNPVFVSKDGTPAEMRGVAVELGRELAKQLGASFEPIRYDSIAKLLDGAKARDWDVAFLGFDAERATLVDFSAPYLELGSTYLVLAGSALRSVGDVDKPGHRIGTNDRSAQERFLTRNIKQAELVRFGPITQEGPTMLSSGKIHALAGNRVALIELSGKIPGSRVLEGQFAPVLHVIGVPKGKPAGAAYAMGFIEGAKASGMVRQAIDRAQLKGVEVAAASSPK
jgi:polar amino acid transport system substrate-binding protein